MGGTGARLVGRLWARFMGLESAVDNRQQGARLLRWGEGSPDGERDLPGLQQQVTEHIGLGDGVGDGLREHRAELLEQHRVPLPVVGDQPDVAAPVRRSQDPGLLGHVGSPASELHDETAARLEAAARGRAGRSAGADGSRPTLHLEHRQSGARQMHVPDLQIPVRQHAVQAAGEGGDEVARPRLPCPGSGAQQRDDLFRGHDVLPDRDRLRGHNLLQVIPSRPSRPRVRRRRACAREAGSARGLRPDRHPRPRPRER